MTATAQCFLSLRYRRGSRGPASTLLYDRDLVRDPVAWLTELGRESRRLNRVGRKLCIRAWRHFFHDEVRTTAKLAGINMVIL
jgi:hypothetical protein